LFEENSYINKHELININTSADGHPIEFVLASGGPRPVRNDWLIHLIGIASKQFIFSPYHSVIFTWRKKIELFK